MLYDIFIYPIEYVLKLIFETSYQYTDSYIVATIILSIVVSTILLPFYYWADNLQAKERSITQRLKPMIDEFKSVYSGSKLHAVTSTLYRQNNYHPIYSLRSVMGLLVQVPFFIAAYHFLLTYQPIVGVETWLFKDLGAPDGWLHIGSLYINVMPFIMTAVNLISGFVFTRGMSRSEEIQIWVLALLFLVLLYASPALLVFYWTLNNIFSLLKNIVGTKVKSKVSPLNAKNEFNYFSKTYKTLKTLIKKLFENISIVEIFFVFILLYIYLIGIIHIAPDGITKTFAIKLKHTLNIVFVVLLFATTFSSTLWNSFKSYRFHTHERYKKSDFLLILLPLAPIVQYVLLNQDTLTIYGSLYIIVEMTLVSMLFIIAIPTLLNKFVSRLLLLALGLSLLFLLFYMPSLALDFSWHQVGSRKIQWSILAIIFLISFLLYKKNDKLLKILIVIFFVSNTVTVTFTMLNVYSDTSIKKDDSILDKMMNMKVLDKPNIYLLVYDAYVGNETMLQYGIDNSKQEDFLTNNGFKIYKGIYSIGIPSLNAMNRVLNMSSKYVKGAALGKGYVYKFLKSHGYKTGVIMRGTYMFQNIIPTIDFYYPLFDTKHHRKSILNSIWEGEFRFDADKKFSKVSWKDFFIERNKYIPAIQKPQFIYTHPPLPSHSQNSGKCMPNEIKLFEQRLNRANDLMTKDINKIIKNDPDAIIIVAGDHGPYLTGNCNHKYKVTRLNLQDRFGTFLAIKWPKSYMTIYDKDITVLQDIFPVIFATLLRKEYIFNKLKVNPDSIVDWKKPTRYIKNGIITDGINKGEPLFLDK